MQIEDESKYRFAYDKNEIDLDKIYSVDVQDAEIKELLSQLFSEGAINYRIMDRQIVLSPSQRNVFLTQQKTITGKVTDSSGIPLPGVTVLVKGTNNGMVTDVDGNYTLGNVPGDGTLVFSFVGMKAQEVAVDGRTTINVKMEEETIGIEEVVAVAYGSVKRKDLTGSISTVEGNLISTQANSTVTRALEGAVAGIQVASIDGQPGLDMGIRLRGIGSSTQNYSNALIVIDGVPAQHDNPLSTINSKDIESVTVLKDAASTALYGSRGANGVILITTKKR